MAKIIKDNVIKIIEPYEYNKTIESSIRNMVYEAFKLTRKYKIYSYDMDLYINNDYDILKCVNYNTCHNCIHFEDLGLKINVFFDTSVDPRCMELHVTMYDENEFPLILAKDEIKYEESFMEKKEKNNMNLFDNDYWKHIINSMYGLPFNGGFRFQPQIKKVIFSGPCTIVLWSDNTKTIVRCVDEDFDKEKGLAMAISKKFLGTNKNKSNYFNVFKKWCKED